jgi:CheY-like chemotaxis protein
MAKVMLIEDDASMVYLLKTLLTMEGFQVSQYSEEENLVAFVRADMPDLLLMDVHLSGANGLDVLREMRTNDDLNRIVVIMASGMYLEKEAIDAGANAFLLKPYMPDDLIQLIRHSLPPQA